jgi:peptidoglycan/LPS O-acetylase OafA/YrhL
VTPATSIFLDLMRFSAAIVVVLHHLTSREFNAAWPHVRFGHEAVIVFFVMSGFVIAYVLHGRERDAEQYAAARLGRLYSVVLPALCLTVVLDALGRSASPALYAGVPDDQAPLRIVINFFYLQQNWNLTVRPLSNGPFWSLGFEFWYYVIFGAWLLLKGRMRIIVTVVACLAAGPRILAAFPIWLLGAAAFNAGSRWAPRRRLATLLLAASGAAFVAMLALGNPLAPLRAAVQEALPGGFLDLGFARIFAGDIPRVPEDLLLGAIFALMIVAVGNAWGERPIPERAAAAIHYLAGSTFSVYLFHVPLLYFLVATLRVDPHDAAGLALVGLLVIAACVALAYAGERQVARYRSVFAKLIGRISSRVGAHPA